MQCYSTWKKGFYDVPQGPMLDPINFNIYLCDLFSFFDGFTVASYADNTTSYSVNKIKDLLKKETKHFSKFLFQWFGFNYLKINSDKSQIGNDVASVNIDNNAITSENESEFISIVFDSINTLYKKASQTLNTLLHTCAKQKERKTAAKVFVTSQCGHCPQILITK